MNRPYQIQVYKNLLNIGSIVTIQISRMARGKAVTWNFKPTPANIKRIESIVKNSKTVEKHLDTFDYYAKWE